MIEIHKDAALIAVDIQRDFCARGALAVPDADAIVPIVNRLVTIFDTTVLTQDSHPEDHVSFQAWPQHCVTGRLGWFFHQGLHWPHVDMILMKGRDLNVESYSGFIDANGTDSGLNGYLLSRGVRHIFVCGLATDYCVQATALDARFLNNDEIPVSVIEDAVRGVAPETTEAARRNMMARGITFVQSDQLVKKWSR